MAKGERQGRIIDEVVARSQGLFPISKAELVERIVDKIKTLALTSDEIAAIHSAICGRMRSKTCFLCGKVKLEIDGEMRFADGDMGKPKRFVCKEH